MLMFDKKNRNIEFIQTSNKNNMSWNVSKNHLKEGVIMENFINEISALGGIPVGLGPGVIMVSTDEETNEAGLKKLVREKTSLEIED